MATVPCAVPQQTTKRIAKKHKLVLLPGSALAVAEQKSTRRFNLEELDATRLMNPEIVAMLQNAPADESAFL
jgi:hypothetical protein